MTHAYHLRSRPARRGPPPSLPPTPTPSSPPPLPSTTALTPSPSTSLLPDYRWLSRIIYSQLSALHDEAIAAHSPSPPPLLLPEVVDLIVDFIWEPLITSSQDLNPNHYSYHPISPSTRLYCTGRVHTDTIVRDDWSDALRERLVRGWRIRSIRYWSGVYANGLQAVVYGHGEERWEVEGLHGSHHQPREAEWVLEEGERIRQVTVEYDVWYHRVVLESSAGRRCEMGRGEPEGRRYSPVVRKALLPEVPGEEYEALAFIYGVGGHIHNLGVYYQRVR